MSDGGKGSSRRPRLVSNEEYASRWDAIFHKDPVLEKPKMICPKCGVDRFQVDCGQPYDRINCGIQSVAQ